MRQALLIGPLIARLPFYYGWIILACACTAAVARAGPAVATLSLFVDPMTREFGWTRTEFSGAVSLGGILAAILSPAIGTFLDRQGARTVLCLAVLTTAATLAMLSQIQSLLAFYCLFCIARLNFAGPFDLGINGALSTWFVRRRALVASIATIAQMGGLVLIPLIGFMATERGGTWRAGWLAIAMAVLVIGFIPTFLLMVRRPEDVGLVPDGGPVTAAAQPTTHGDKAVASAPAPPIAEEPAFSRAEALRTRAFWMLGLFTAAVYPVQAGMSLHAASHLMERGLPLSVAATCVTIYSLTSAVTGVAYSALAQRAGVRAALAVAGLFLAVAGVVTALVTSSGQAMAGALLFGVGLGGLHVVLPVAWADYFGRRNFGAIRGVALTIQVTAQAAGPLLSGILRDATGSYVTSLLTFATLSALSILAALLVRAPARPA